MLEKIYCHTLPKRWDIKSTYCEVGKWYYYHSYRAATKDAHPSTFTHFDIKEDDNELSRPQLCMHISDMHLFFYTKDEYRNKLISELVD